MLPPDNKGGGGTDPSITSICIVFGVLHTTQYSIYEVCSVTNVNGVAKQQQSLNVSYSFYILYKFQQKSLYGKLCIYQWNTTQQSRKCLFLQLLLVFWMNAILFCMVATCMPGQHSCCNHS